MSPASTATLQKEESEAKVFTPPSTSKIDLDGQGFTCDEPEPPSRTGLFENILFMEVFAGTFVLTMKSAKHIYEGWRLTEARPEQRMWLPGIAGFGLHQVQHDPKLFWQRLSELLVADLNTEGIVPPSTLE